MIECADKPFDMDYLLNFSTLLEHVHMNKEIVFLRLLCTMQPLCVVFDVLSVECQLV